MVPFIPFLFLLCALLFAPAHAADPAASSPFPGMVGGGGDALDITADQSLEWNEKERVYTARGNAKAKRGDVLVEADTLKAYDRKKADGSSEIWKMTAEGHVRVSGKDSVATGAKAEYTIDTRKAVLTGDDLKLTMGSDTVTAKKSLEYWETENLAFAKGDAEAVRDGRTVRADEMVARLKPNKKGELDISTLEAKGNVHIVATDDAIFCDNVVYDIANNKAVLTGNVNITRGANQLKGQRVETDFTTGKSRLLSNGKGRVHALISAAKSGPAPAAPGKKPDARPAPPSTSFFMKPANDAQSE